MDNEQPQEIKRSLLSRATAIAAMAHENQWDKAGAPYILHPIRLMMRAATENEQIAAVLHDVVEDSDWTLERLAEEGFSEEVIAALDCLTCRSGEMYDAFIDRVLTNALASRVKLLDIEDNMTLTRLSTLSEKDITRIEKYHRAYLQIKNHESPGRLKTFLI